MSFWGARVAPNEAAKVDSAGGRLLHVSQACLDSATPASGSARVLVEKAGTSFAVAHLKAGGSECCSLDLFVNLKEAKLKVTGDAVVHLTGYFEASEDMDVDSIKAELETKSKETKTQAKVEAKSKVAAQSKPVEEEEKPKSVVKAPAEGKAKDSTKEDEDEEDDEEEEDEEEEAAQKKPAAAGTGRTVTKDIQKRPAAPAKAPAKPAMKAPVKPATKATAKAKAVMKKPAKR